MKVVAGIVAAGTLAGAVAVSTGDLFSVGGGDGVPAPVNPYKGMQDREEVFEFTQKPSVKKEGDKWVISFASKGKCDATVAVLDKDGKIVRHLASGVLGVNAPRPFQQNSLSQKVEWDGEDDTGKKAPAGCKVRVSLGLKPEFEMNIGYDPYDLPVLYYKRTDPQYSYLVAKGAEGERYILCITQKGGYQGRVFDKDGKYVRTFWPPAAKDVEKLAQFKPLNPRDGYRFAETTWGDKVLVCGGYGPAMFNGDARKLSAVDIGKAMFYIAGVTGYKEEKVFPAGLAAKKLKLPATQAWAIFNCHCPRLVADRYREEIYAGFGNLFRFDGRTGKPDAAWTPRGELRSATEGHVGPDGLLYLRVGGANYGQWVIRMDHDGKTVPFTGDGAAPMPQKEWPDAKGKGFYCGNGWSKALNGQNVIALWTGARSHSNVHTRGLYVSPRGLVVATDYGIDKTWGLKHGLPADWPTKPSQLGAEWPIFSPTCVLAWDKDGNVITVNAVGNMFNGHGVAMDRDGNIYSALGSQILPKGQTTLAGITGFRNTGRHWGAGGTLVKFRGLGGKYPMGTHYMKGEGAPPTALAFGPGYSIPEQSIDGALWSYGGLVAQPRDCSCHNVRYDMDYFARHWIPSNQLYSVTVLDANGNRIARLGRYGNVDDSDEDIKAGKDGLRFVWPRAVAVSDTALYVTDTGNRRILKAKLGYHAEETVGLDGNTSSAPVSTSAPTATAPVSPKTPAAPASSVPATRSPEQVCRGLWSLAMSYKRAGRADKAREYLQRIVEEHPKNDYATRARQELARL